ncbi:MAG: ABC transporter ATP-binding protein [Bacteroidia bacterium]
MKALFALNIYLLKYRWPMLAGIGFVVLSNVLAVLVPSFLRQGLDDALFQSLWMRGEGLGDLPDRIGHLALAFGAALLLAAVAKGVFMYYMRQTLVVVSRKVEFDLKNQLYAKYQRLGEGFYRQHFTGDLMSRIGEDVSNVRMYIGPAIMYFANVLFTFIAVLYQMIKVNAELTLWVLLPLPILSVSIYHVSRLINVGNKRIQEQLSTLTTLAQETFSGIRVIKSFGAEFAFNKRFYEEGLEFQQRNLKLAKVNALFFPLMLFLMGLSTLLVLYLGGKAVEEGTFSPGNMAEFILYLNMLIWPVASLGWTTALVQKAAASQKRINEFLDYPEPQEGDGVGYAFDRELSIDIQSFQYAGKSEPALHGIKGCIPKGSILGITGKTGSGKSTLMQLLAAQLGQDSGARFEGDIRLDGLAVSSIQKKEYRAHLAYVPQDVFLFSETIEENIMFGTQAQDRQADTLNKAIEWAQLQRDLSQWPQGLQTLLGERGVSLSGGQKQRVSLARALVRDADLYLLDDCLSAVDAETEQAIISQLKIELKGKTAIIVSHRIAPLQFTDEVWVLEEGTIAQRGSHESLLEQEGLYKQLYEMQHEQA